MVSLENPPLICWVVLTDIWLARPCCFVSLKALWVSHQAVLLTDGWDTRPLLLATALIVTRRTVERSSPSRLSMLRIWVSMKLTTLKKFTKPNIVAVLVSMFEDGMTVVGKVVEVR